VGPVVLDFLACQMIGRRLQVLDSTFGLLEGKGHQHLALRNEARAPKIAGHLHLVEGYRLQRLIGGMEGKAQEQYSK
jgi:hypothetical protein